MPIYEYQCTDCGASHEALQKLSDSPLVDCPACAQPSLKKRISVAGFRLSGGGWYETDFKSGDNKKNLSGTETGEKSETTKTAQDTTSATQTSQKDKPANKTEAASKPD
jgi:putative FmdB family regulatory protein